MHNACAQGSCIITSVLEAANLVEIGALLQLATFGTALTCITCVEAHTLALQPLSTKAMSSCKARLWGFVAWGMQAQEAGCKLPSCRAGWQKRSSMQQ